MCKKLKVRCKMRSVWKVAVFFGLATQLVAAEKPDVQTIINKANIVAYYQGTDGKDQSGPQGSDPAPGRGCGRACGGHSFPPLDL